MPLWPARSTPVRQSFVLARRQSADALLQCSVSSDRSRSETRSSNHSNQSNGRSPNSTIRIPRDSYSPAHRRRCYSPGLPSRCPRQQAIPSNPHSHSKLNGHSADSATYPRSGTARISQWLLTSTPNHFDSAATTRKISLPLQRQYSPTTIKHPTIAVKPYATTNWHCSHSQTSCYSVTIIRDSSTAIPRCCYFEASIITTTMNCSQAQLKQH